MKKVLVLILMLCLVAGVSVPALAAGRPKISEQPVSATTDEKGNVSFTVKASNVEGLTWRFVNPETGEEITGKNLSKKIKGLTVEGANKKTIKLIGVPEEMNGWTVYCHITGGNGYKVDSDRVMLTVYGMTTPEFPTPAPDPIAEPDPVVPDSGTSEVIPSPDDTQSTPAPADTATAPVQDDTSTTPVEEIPENTSFTIRGENVTLYPMDAYGNRMEDEAAAVLTFEDIANVAVQANGEVKYWTVNGMRIEPSASLSGFTLRNVTADLTISAALSGSTVSESNDTLVHITCEGCTFTYGKGGLKSEWLQHQRRQLRACRGSVVPPHCHRRYGCTHQIKKYKNMRLLCRSRVFFCDIFYSCGFSSSLTYPARISTIRAFLPPFATITSASWT